MRAFCLCLVLLSLAATVAAETRRLAADLLLASSPVPAGWQLVDEPPDVAVRAMVDDMRLDAAQNGRKVDEGALEQTAQRYVRANELWLVRPETGAFAMIDISPLNDDEAAPDHETLRASALHALVGIEEHAAEPAQVDWQLRSRRVSGMQAAVELQASYRALGPDNDPASARPRRFLGLIGFAAPYWVYLYANDPLADPADAVTLRAWFDQVGFVRP
ncbi:MAG: hypothetical protein Tsb0017_10360 [Geothermobacteraceae bacterium]